MSKETDRQARDVGLGVLIFAFLFFIIIGFLYWRTSDNNDSNFQTDQSITNNDSSSSQADLAAGWTNEQKINLSKNLASKNVILYYGNSCPHCHDQLEAFGQGKEFLKKIDCYLAKNSQVCTEKNIEGVPSWIYNNEKKEGTQTLDDLAAWIGYKK